MGTARCAEKLDLSLDIVNETMKVDKKLLEVVYQSFGLYLDAAGNTTSGAADMGSSVSPSLADPAAQKLMTGADRASKQQLAAASALSRAQQEV